MKRCSHCTQTKKEEYFHKNKSKKDGLSLWCKECNREWKQGYMKRNKQKIRESSKVYRAKNRDKLCKHNLKMYYADHEENKRKGRERMENVRKLDPEKSKADGRRYYWRHRDKRLVQMREWRANNKDIVKRLAAANHARRRNAEGEFTADDVNDLYLEQMGICAYCQIELQGSYHVDHKTPITRGGTNYPSNLQLTCADCNKSKFTKTHEEYILLLSSNE